MKAVILAGGVGSRLWPLSRQKKPKQFCRLVSSESLINDTYRRLLRILPSEKIYFSISQPFADLLKEHCPDLEDKQLIIEPEKRDTGPAMGYAAALLELVDPDEPVVFVPADHYIADEEKFFHCLKIGEQLIQETGKMLDIGITPTFPSTVLGYTKIGDLYKENGGVQIFNFAGHSEKPPYEIAKQYLEDGSYLWHASYYMWTPRRFMEAFDLYASSVGKTLREIQKLESDGVLKCWSVEVLELYKMLPQKSFDYLITEKINPVDVLIIKGEFGWSDIGAWDTLYDRLAAPEENITQGDSILLDTQGSLIYAPEGKTVVVLGMKDVVVIDTTDALLVCPRAAAQRVKEIIKKLEEEKRESLL